MDAPNSSTPTGPTGTVDCRAQILVVDDEPGVLYVVRRSLETQGYAIDTVESYPEALERLSDNPYELLISDVNIGEHSGIELLNFCRVNLPDLEVILITGKPALNDAVQTVRKGAYDYLPKPVEPSLLRSTAAAALERRQQKREQFTHTMALGRKLELGLRVVRTLGSGSMGIVVLAERDGVYYALKMLQLWRDSSPGGKSLGRFAREAQVLSKIDHPNVVKIHDYSLDTETETPYILMEYVDGEPLTYFLRGGHMTVLQKLLVVRQIAEALQAVHAQGVIHRDIKPSNVMVTNDYVAKLTDFGIARLSLDMTLTATGDLVGSPTYMSPESFRGQEIDHRADLFSLGVLAFELLTGARPFQGDNIHALVQSICHDPAPDPARTASDWPQGVTPWLHKLLAKNRDERHADAAAVVHALDLVLAGLV